MYLAFVSVKSIVTSLFAHVDDAVYCLNFLTVIFMRTPPDIVGDGSLLSVCPVVPFVRSFVRSSGRILFPRYLMNALSNFDETDREYSLAPTMT